MKIRCNQILLVTPAEENCDSLRKTLASHGFNLATATTLPAAIEHISLSSPDLIICHHRMKHQTGFYFYNHLQPVLAQKDIPFILYLKEFIKEDIIIGLELGIDSFIIYPFDTNTLLRKVNKQIKNRQKGKILDDKKFNIYFESTPVAKFVAKFERLIRINNAFAKLTGIDKGTAPLPKMDEVFDFSCNEVHKFNLYKCLNGLKELCLFDSIPLIQNSSCRFDIHMVWYDYFGQNLIPGEIVKVENQVEVNGHKNGEISGKKSVVSLTQRERQVLDLSSQGLSIKQIAHQMNISARTVEKHRANIMEKTETSSIIEAIYYLQN